MLISPALSGIQSPSLHSPLARAIISTSLDPQLGRSVDNAGDDAREAARHIKDRLVDGLRRVASVVGQAVQGLAHMTRDACSRFAHLLTLERTTNPSDAAHTLRPVRITSPGGRPALAVAKQLAQHLRAHAHDERITSGLFRTSARATELNRARTIINRGLGLDLAVLSTGACAGLVKEIMAPTLGMSAADVQKVARITLALPASASMREVSNALAATSDNARSEFSAALIKQLHANIDRATQGDARAAAFARSALNDLAFLFATASEDSSKTFHKGAMAVAFNLMASEIQAPAPGSFGPLMAVNLAVGSRIIWDALGEQSVQSARL